MSYSKRTRTLKNGSFIGKSVLYWMVRDKRFNDNWALLAAQKAALKNKVPLLYANIIPRQNSNKRI